jgi:hypothetical protein
MQSEHGGAPWHLSYLGGGEGRSQVQHPEKTYLDLILTMKYEHKGWEYGSSDRVLVRKSLDSIPSNAKKKIKNIWID